MINNTHHSQVDNCQNNVLIELIVNVQKPAYADWELLTLDKFYRYPKGCGAVTISPLYHAWLVIDIICLVTFCISIRPIQK